jgi:hypothetical protein
VPQQHLAAAARRLAAVVQGSVEDLAVVLLLVLAREAAGTAAVQVLAGCSGLKQKKKTQIILVVWRRIAG